MISLATAYTSRAIGRNVAVPVALTNGFRLAYLIAAGLVVAAAVVTFALVKAPAVAPVTQRWTLVGGVVLLVACFTGVSLAAAQPAAPIGAYTTNGAYNFVSAPGLHPPKVRPDMATDASQLAPGTLCWPTFTT